MDNNFTIPDFLRTSNRIPNKSSRKSNITSKHQQETIKPDSMLEKQIRALKRERKAAYKTISTLKAVILLLVCIIIGGSVFFYTEYKKLKEDYLKLQKSSKDTAIELSNLKDGLSDIENVMNSESEMLLKTSQIVVELDSEIESLKTDNLALQETNNSLVDQLAVYEKRKELFDKHENAVLSSTGARTDITYDDMMMLEDLTKKMNMTSETQDLIYALVRHESDGNQNAKNSTSTATGLGQFLSGTGQFVYTKLMKGSGYVHSKTATDHTTNLKMMVYYLDYLDKNHGSITGVLDEYRGYHDPKYLNEVDRILQRYNGITLASIKIHKK